MVRSEVTNAQDILITTGAKKLLLRHLHLAECYDLANIGERTAEI